MAYVTLYQLKRRDVLGNVGRKITADMYIVRDVNSNRAALSITSAKRVMEMHASACLRVGISLVSSSGSCNMA